jgi:putative transposase
LVFVPTYRWKTFTDTVPTRAEEIMREVRADFETEPKQFNAKPEAATGHP